MGAAVGGIVGQSAASGARGDANNDQNEANSIIQNLQSADDMSRPILIQQYVDQGKLTPQQAQDINQTVSQTAGIKTGGAGEDAQLQALKQLGQVSQQGMSAQDRAALNQVQQQTNAQTNGNIQSILQNAAARGQATSGSTLAAQLAAAQQGANAQSQGANQIAGQAQQNALNATAQMGGLGGQVENTQFGENLTKAQAADQMNRFNIQNQLGVQQQNVNANNQAQYANLANQQNIANQNTSAANQAAYAQRAGEQQNFNNQNSLATLKSNSLTGQANNLNAQGDAIAKSDSAIGGALDAPALSFLGGGGKAMAAMNQGGKVGNSTDYRNGGPVPGKAKMPGDHPANDTVDAKLSPGEIVIPRSLAKSSLGDKLLDLLNHHHEVKKHLDKIDEKASKSEQKFSDGGESQSLGDQVSNYFSTQGSSQAQPQQESNSPEMQDAMRKAFHFAQGGQIPAMPPMAPPQPMLTQQPPMKQTIPMLPPQTSAPMALDKNDLTYLAKLMQQYKSIGKSTKKHPNLNGPVRKFDEGGEVESDNGVLSTIGKALKKSFSTPPPTDKPVMSQDEKNDLVRKQNTERANGTRNSMVSMDPDSTLNSYSDGGEVEDNSTSDQEPLDMSDVTSSRSPGEEDVEFNRPEVITGNIPKKLEDMEEDKDPDSKALENKYEDEEFEAAEKADDSDKDKKVADSKDSDDKEDEDREPASEDSDKSDDKDNSDDSDDDTAVASSDASEDGDTPVASGNAKQAPNALADAQRQRRMMNIAAGVLKGGALLGAGLSRTDPTQQLKLIDEENKNNNISMQEYAEQIANQKNDPNSPVSMAVRNYMNTKGIKIPDNASASDLLSVAPYMAKDASLQAGIQKAILQSQTRLQGINTQQAGADKRATDKNAIEQQKADAATENAKTNKELKATAKQDAANSKTVTALESARGNPAAAQAEKDLYSSQKVNSLLNIYPNLDKIPDAQVNLIISEVGKEATGGVPTGHEQEALKPNTPANRLAKLFGQLQNNPTGANAGAYLKELQKYNNVLAKDAQQVIKDKYGRVIESNKNAIGDNNYKTLQQQYINRFDPKVSASGQASGSSGKVISQAQADAYSQAHGADGLQKLLGSGYSIGQ